MNMSYTSPTIEFSLDVLNGAEFDLTSRAYGKGETERCVETPWAAQTFAKVNRVLDIGLAMSHPDYLGLMIGFLDKGGKIEGADIIKPERVKTRYPEAWRKPGPAGHARPALLLETDRCSGLPWATRWRRTGQRKAL